MYVGIAGPISLELLNFNEKMENLPFGSPFPMISMLVNRLLKEGINVVVFTSSPGITRRFIIETKNLILCVIPQRIHAARYFYKTELKELTKLMLRYRCDVINAQWSYEFALAALKTDIPTIVTLQDHALTILKLMIITNNSLSTKLHWSIRFLINQIVLRRSKCLSVNSKYLYNLLPQKYKDKTRIINNFYSSELESGLIPFEKKENIIVSVSNGFSKRKNIDSALKAFKIVRSKIPEIEYYLIGDDMGQNEKAYNYAYKNNLHFGVRFLGRIKFEEIKKKISKAKIFLHPSREESFGMAVLEAMVLGTTVIGGSNSGNIPNLLENGNAGIICNINSSEEIANAILKLYSNQILDDKLRKNALNSVKEHYSEDKIIEQYLSYYYDILKGKIKSD